MIELESPTGKSERLSGGQTSTQQAGGQEAGVSAIRFLTQLARSKKRLSATAAAGGVVGLAYCLYLAPIYTATTRIMTPQQSQSSAALLMTQLANTGAASLAAAAGGNALGLKNPNDLYIGLLTSRPVADAIIQQFGLMGVYKTRDLTETRRVLAGSTKVSSEKSGLITVSVNDKDKKRAAGMANAYTEQLRLMTKTLAITEASQRRMFYEEQLKKAKDDLVAAEVEFQQVQQQKGLVQLDAQARATIERLAALHAQIAAKQVELQALRSYSTERNPSVQLAENQLSSLHIEAARLEQHSGSSEAANLGLQDMATAGLDYLRAQHELQYRQVLFDLLLKQYDAARLDEAKYAAVIQVVEPAIAPDRKSAPRRSMIVLVFIMLGFFGGISHLLASSYIHSNPAVSRALGELAAAASVKATHQR
jgi:tyrosine-protein kinase Etk/Wzc